MLEAYSQHPEAFTSSYAERAQLPLSWWEERLASDETSKEMVFGCFDNSTLCGVTGLSFETREKARHKAILFGMYVPSNFRRDGLGSALLRHAMAHASTHQGVRVVQLTVTDGNRSAKALYERHGFIQFGLEPFAVAVGSTFVSKAHMWCKVGQANPSTTRAIHG